MNGVTVISDYDLGKPNLYQLVDDVTKTPNLKVLIVIRTRIGQPMYGYLSVLASKLKNSTALRGQSLTLENGTTILVVGEGYLVPVRGRQIDVAFIRPDAAPSVLNTVIPCLIASKVKRVVYYE